MFKFPSYMKLHYELRVRAAKIRFGRKYVKMIAGAKNVRLLNKSYSSYLIELLNPQYFMLILLF